MESRAREQPWSNRTLESETLDGLPPQNSNNYTNHNRHNHYY